MSGGVDPTNPLDRKFMDDMAGAINRREIAEKPYDDELAAYQQFLNGWRRQRGAVVLVGCPGRLESEVTTVSGQSFG